MLCCSGILPILCIDLNTHYFHFTNIINRFQCAEYVKFILKLLLKLTFMYINQKQRITYVALHILVVCNITCDKYL